MPYIQLDGSIRVWEAATGKQLHQFQHEADIDCPQRVAFSPDGKMLAACGLDGPTLWEVISEKKLRHWSGFGDTYEVAFSPDSKALAMAGRNLVVVDIATGQELRRGKSDRVFSSLAFSADGKLLASGVLNEKGGVGDLFGLWEVDTGKMVHQLKGQRSDKRGFAFSADGKTLAIASGRSQAQTTGNEQPMICLWDVRTGKEIRQWPRQADISGMAFSPDGKSLCTGSGDGTIRLWETATGKPIHPFDLGPVLGIAVSGDGRTLAALTGRGHNPIEGNTIRLYEATTWKETGVHHHPGSTSIALSGNGQILASGAKGICLWETATGKELWRWKEADFVYSLAFSPDGRNLASSSQQNRLCLWETATGRQLRRFGDALAARCIAFSADGKTLAVGSARSTTGADHDNGVQLWDVTTGQKLSRFLFPPETGDIRVAFSADGKTLAAAGSTFRTGVSSIRAWDIATGREYPSFTTKEDRITSVALSPDGKTGVISSADYYQTRPILLWEVATGKERGRLQGHTGRVQSLAFFGAGRRLASGSSDTTVLIWDALDLEGPRPGQPAEISSKELESLWSDLAAHDAAKAYQAIRTLIASPRQSVSFLDTRLRPAAAVDPKLIARLIAELDHEDFATRDQATHELEKLGEQAEPALQNALKNPSPEARRRVEQLLAKIGTGPVSAQALPAWRAIEVLEHVGTEAARKLLAKLAQGASAAPQTREAKAALQRLAGRSSGKK